MFVNLIFESTGVFLICFFFNDTATTEIYTLSLHDALPIWAVSQIATFGTLGSKSVIRDVGHVRSEEHTSELQSPTNIVCRLLLEKKKCSLYRIFPHASTEMAWWHWVMVCVI